MQGFPSRERVNEIKEKYPKGTKIKLISMNDSQAPKSGSVGTVTHVDDTGQIHMAWETGSSLALIPDVDSFEIVK